jgi:hypothetical protein
VHQGLVAADGGIGADLEVGPAQFVLDLLVALLDPVADAVDPVPFGNSSLLLGAGLAFHHGLLDPCPGDRLSGVPGGSEAARVPGVAVASGCGQGRGTACAATRERGAAQAAHKACAVRAGGSAVVRGAVVADPPVPVGERVPGDARDAARMAPQADRSEVGLQQAPGQARETADRACGEGAGAAAGQGRGGAADGSRANSSGSDTRSARRRSGKSSQRRASTQPHAGEARRGASSGPRKPRPTSPATSYTST